MITVDRSKLRKDPWNFKDNEVKLGKSTEPTNYTCVVCGDPILKVYSTEIDRQTGDIITAVLAWDMRYTCCENCHKKWEQASKTGWDLDGCVTGVSKRDRLVKIGAAYIGQQDLLLRETSIEDIKEEFKQEDEDFFSVESK